MTRRARSPVEQIEWMRNLLAFLLVGAFVSTIPMFVFKSIPEANEQVVTYMVGQLSGMALMALGFYFVNKVGQDALDATRADNTGKMAEAVIAAANATPIDPNKTAAAGAQQAADAAGDVADELGARPQGDPE